MRVALVNTNRMRPPIGPIGLDYIAESLAASGHTVDMLDLCWAADCTAAIASFFRSREYGLVGVSLRNTDDCANSSRQSFVGEFTSLVKTIRAHTSAFVVVGGVGFSVMPESILQVCDADGGVWADGEGPLIQLAEKLEAYEDLQSVENLILPSRNGWTCTAACPEALDGLPPMSRAWIDNQRYFREGGQAGFETKRGCAQACTYCADPVAKGRMVRLRSPEAVVHEVGCLVKQGIDHLHTCDSEFNLPQDHALEVCCAFVDHKLNEKTRWYAYCSARRFSAKLARAMRRAGCVGINFGVDSGDDGMLRRLKRDYVAEDIIRVARLCREAGITVMFDLLLGSPGETEASIRSTLETMRIAQPDQVGISLGVRVYPGTELAQHVAHLNPQGQACIADPEQPVFFMEPAVAETAVDLLDRLIGDDRRFFFFDSSRPERNYNYNANEVLVDAIAVGRRGAYWDILRRTS